MVLHEVYVPPLARALFKILHTIMMMLFPIGRKSTQTLLAGVHGLYIFPPSLCHPLGESVFCRSWAPLLASSLLLQLLWVLVYHHSLGNTSKPSLSSGSDSNSTGAPTQMNLNDPSTDDWGNLGKGS